MGHQTYGAHLFFMLVIPVSTYVFQFVVCHVFKVSEDSHSASTQVSPESRLEAGHVTMEMVPMMALVVAWATVLAMTLAFCMLVCLTPLGAFQGLLGKCGMSALTFCKAFKNLLAKGAGGKKKKTSNNSFGKGGMTNGKWLLGSFGGAFGENSFGSRLVDNVGAFLGKMSVDTSCFWKTLKTLLAKRGERKRKKL